MALGDGGNYSTNQNKERKDPTVYSPISFKNPEAKVDPSEISFKFWRNLLGITISPKLERKPGDTYDKYDRENNITIHITHAKARMFRNGILKMLKDDSIPDVSVSSGQNGLITFSNGREYGVDNYMIIIRNLDPQSGSVEAAYSYEINGKGYNTILNFKEADSSFDTELYAALEIECILDLLEEFYKSTNYALAYTVVDAMKFDIGRLNTKSDLMMEKLGIEKSSKSNYKGNGKSFFDNVRDGNKNVNQPSAVNKPKDTSLDDLARGFSETGGTNFEEDDDLPF